MAEKDELWQAIKTEYITKGTSYRKLAEKYGVSDSQINRRGGKEKWVEKREQFKSKTTAKTLKKISSKQANRAARFLDLGDKLFKKIEDMVESEDPLTEKGIKELTIAVKNLMDIQHVRSPLDEREQKARIANLEKQAKEESREDGPKLVVEGMPEEFKV